MEEYNKNVNKDLENIIRAENTIMERKNALDEMSGRLYYTEERISNLEDRLVEIIQWE